MSAAPRVDFAAECIWRDGDRINLPPKAFQVLRRLMERPNELVTKQQILDVVWPDTHVVDKVLTVAIVQLRQAFGDDVKRARYIETVHRRGFRWIGEQRIEPDSAALAAPRDEASVCVGRDAALGELERCYLRTAAHSRQLVLVSGDPGIGKTTLVDQFIKEILKGSRIRGFEGPSPLQSRSSSNSRTLEPSDPYVARGQSIDGYSAVEPYGPIYEALECLWRSGDNHVRAVLRQQAPTWLMKMPELAAELDLEELRRNVTVTTSERMERELVHALEEVSSNRAVVLVLEDLHWSDPATVGLLWTLAVRRSPARLLMIGSYRPIDAIVHGHPITRLRYELMSKRLCTDLALDGLDKDGVAAYLDQRFLRHRFPTTFADRLQRQTSGNPLFLFNALEDFERRGWLSQPRGEWQCSVDLDTLGAAIPEGTHDLIAYRIEQLPEPTQRILEVASAVGMEFAVQVVAAALDSNLEEVEAECERLVRNRLFLRDGENLNWIDGSRGRRREFCHEIYRRVIYRRIAPTRRQVLHRRIAEYLEKAGDHPSHQIAAQVSHHYEQAGDPTRAVDWIETMLQTAYVGRGTPEVEALLARAVALMKQLPESDDQQRRLLQLTVEHGIVLASLRGVTDSAPVRQIFEEARSLASSMTISTEHISSLGFTAATEILSGRLHAAYSRGEQQLAFCGADTPRFIVVHAQMMTGIALLYMGDVDRSRPRLQAADESLAAATTAERATAVYDPTVALRMALGLAHVLAGRVQSGWSSVVSGLAHARTIGMPAYLGPALSQATGIAILRRELAMAREFATELLSLCETSGLPLWMEAAQVQLRWLEIIERRDGELLEPLRQAVENFHRTGGLGAGRMFAMLADGYQIAGRIDQASAALDRAFDTRGEECFYDVELLRKRAALLTERAAVEPQGGSQSEVAEHFLERAIDLATAQGTHLFGLRASVDLCRLWHASGRGNAAKQRLSDTIADFDSSGDGTDLSEARTLLQEL